MIRIAVIIQARLGSSRLPGKVMRPLAGKPVLARMLERVADACTPIDIVVATTPATEDDAIRRLCRQQGIRCVTGHPTDLLDRHAQAAHEVDADVIVRVPSDCPLIDPDAIDGVIRHYLAFRDHYDFVSNLHPPSWPDGNDVEVMPREVLETAFREAREPVEREHITPFITDRPERFRIGNLVRPGAADLSASHRLVLDYAEDYELIRTIYDELWTPGSPVFTLQDVLALIDARPELRRINAMHHGVSWRTLEVARAAG